MWNGMHGFGWGLGGLGMALFWLVMIVAVVTVARVIWDRAPRHREAGESPLQTLERRYARGEIDKAEFDEKRKQLS